MSESFFELILNEEKFSQPKTPFELGEIMIRLASAGGLRESGFLENEQVYEIQIDLYKGVRRIGHLAELLIKGEEVIEILSYDDKDNDYLTLVVGVCLSAGLFKKK